MAKKISFKNSIVLTNSPGYAEYLLKQKMMLSRNPNSEKKTQQKLEKLLFMRSKIPYILIKSVITTACLRQYCNQKLHYFARQ